MRKNPLVIEKPKIAEKGWGHEVQFINCDEYCGKVLHFEKGHKGSLHYHIDKHETWYISKGTIKIKSMNPDSADSYELIANEGDMIDIPRGIIHQVESLTVADIFEVSTHDDSEDNYRVEKGDSQK